MTAPLYPVEVSAPDIARWRCGNTGWDYVHSFVADRPGRHVIVSALVHGNEICGAIALDLLLRTNLRPAVGRLTIVFVNVAAFGRFDPADPDGARFVDEDFNRLWSPAVLDGPRDSVELGRARELRPLLDTADLLLDLHSLQHPQEPLLLAGPLIRGRKLAERVGYPATIVCDAGHAAGVRMRDYGRFGERRARNTALLVECGQHWAAGTDRVAITAVLRFLATVGVVEPAFARKFQDDQPVAARRVIEVTEAVTVRDQRFSFVCEFRGLEVIPAAGTLIARDGEREVRTPYDACVLVMPSRRLHPGQTAVRFGRVVA